MSEENKKGRERLWEYIHDTVEKKLSELEKKCNVMQMQIGEGEQIIINHFKERIEVIESKQVALWKYLNGDLTSKWQNKIEQQNKNRESVLINQKKILMSL